MSKSKQYTERIRKKVRLGNNYLLGGRVGRYNAGMNIWQVVLQIAITLAAIVLTAMIHTRLKFAPTRAAAVHELTQLALTILIWVGIAYSVGFLIFTVASSEPLTRVAVFMIAYQLVLLMANMLLMLITRTNRTIGRVIDQILETELTHARTTRQIIENSERLAEAVSALATQQAA